MATTSCYNVQFDYEKNHSQEVTGLKKKLSSYNCLWYFEWLYIYSPENNQIYMDGSYLFNNA